MQDNDSMLSRVLSFLGRTPGRVTSPAIPDRPASPVKPVRPARTLQPGVILYDEGQPVRRVCVKKYGAGKSYAWISGPDKYAAVAAECLLRSFTTVSCIMEDLFRERMREKGVPDAVTDEFLRGARVDDEAFLAEPE